MNHKTGFKYQYIIATEHLGRLQAVLSEKADIL
jgi:hypothetical protein